MQLYWVDNGDHNEGANSRGVLERIYLGKLNINDEIEDEEW